MNEENVFDPADIEKNKTNGILMAVIPILFFLPLVADDMKSSAYLKFMANQTLIVLIAAVGVGIAGTILCFIPFIGGLLAWLLGIAAIALYVIDIVYAANGSGQKLPVVGSITIIK